MAPTAELAIFTAIFAAIILTVARIDRESPAAMSLYALKSPWKNSVLDYSKLQGKVLLIFNSATK